MIAGAGITATSFEIAERVRRAEAARFPRRLAQWRLRLLDRMLEQIEELRLSGERRLPEDVRATIEAFARIHDPALLAQLRPGRKDLDTAHDAVFDAQGRVMLDLAACRALDENLPSPSTGEDTKEVLQMTQPLSSLASGVLKRGVTRTGPMKARSRSPSASTRPRASRPASSSNRHAISRADRSSRASPGFGAKSGSRSSGSR